MASGPSQSGSARFYDQLWPHRADVLRKARSATASAAEAEELAQETLLRGFATLDNLEPGVDVKAWLMQILENARMEWGGASPIASAETAGEEQTNSESDTARLDAMLEMQIPRPARNRMEGFFRLPLVRVVVAFIAIVGIGALIFRGLSSGALLASPDVMAPLHDELINGKVPAKPIGSIADANKALADELKFGLQIPPVPADDQVIKCQARTIKDKHVACVLLLGDGVPVTMVIANSMDMRTPESEYQLKKGTEYHILTSGRLHMVMAERHGRWMCLISELPIDRLAEVAGDVEL